MHQLTKKEGNKLCNYQITDLHLAISRNNIGYLLHVGL